MNRTTIDLWVGLFVAIGIAALVFLALRVANLTSSNAGETYLLQARFDNIGGLKVRAPVRSAGVVVGRVTAIDFDSTHYEAVVKMQVSRRYAFPRDTFATILTSGLLGEQFVGLEAGGDIESLQAGDLIKKTQSAVVLEKLIGQFLFSKAAEGQEKKQAQ